MATEVVIGMESTEHYLLTLARCLKNIDYRVVTVNPVVAKMAKELWTILIGQKLIIEIRALLHNVLRREDIQDQCWMKVI